MKKISAALATSIISFSLLSLPVISTNAAVKSGASCTKAGQVKKSKGDSFVCTKRGKKLTWKKLASAAPSPAPSQSSSPVPTPPPSTTPVPTTTLSPAPTPSPIPSPTPTKQEYVLTDVSKFQSMASCQITSTITGKDRLHLGFPRSKEVIPYLGEHRAITLFVYFDDLPPEQKQIDEWKNNQIPTFERFTESMSYGKLRYRVETLDQFLHIKKSVLSYNLDTPHDEPMKPTADVRGLVRDAVAAADPYVDFSKYQFVNVVTAATTKIGFEGVFMQNGLIEADGVRLNNATFGPIREYVDDPFKKIWLLHEAGHLWGLIHPFKTGGESWGRAGYPKFSGMANGASRAPEFLAWERFVLDWFREDQVACISTPTEETYTLKISDLAPNAPGVKMFTIKLASNEALVLESRKMSRDSQISPEEQGIFAYHVNADILTNLGVAKVIYKDNPPATGWYPSTLAKGDKATFRSYTIEILDSDSTGEVVKVSIKK